MSIDPTVPPSIPPRKKAAGLPGPRPSPSEPRIVSPAQAGPTVTAGPSAPTKAAAPAQPETPPASSAMTGAMKRVLKSASSAVAGATAVVTGESVRTAGSSPTSPGASRLDSTKAAPTIAGTDTRSTTTTTPHDPDGSAVPPGAPGSVRTPTTSRVPVGKTTSARVPTSATSTGRDGAPRRVRLSISRVDPWSVMKLSFLLSVAIGLMIVVAAAVVWFVLDGLMVFTKVNDMITEIVGEESKINFLQFVEFSRVVSGATVVAVVDVVLLTALSTIGAFLYNITAALVGGVTLTLTDD